MIAIEAPAPAPDTFANHAWGRFARIPARGPEAETVDIATDGKTGDQWEYKLRLKRRMSDGSTEQLWTNSRTCPSVRVVLRNMRALEVPAIVPDGFAPRPSEVLVDGIGYSLVAPLADPAGLSHATWTSNVGTPLAAYVDTSMALLLRCWSVVELRVDPTPSPHPPTRP